jgi:integrase
MKVHMTKAVVASLPVGTHQDTKVTGLVCNVTEHSRRFGVYVSVKNVPTRKSIGSTDDWSVEAARIEAQKIITALREAPQARQQRTTLDELTNLYTAHLETAGRKTSDYARRDVDASWSHLKDRKLDDITVMELAEGHNKITKTRGPIAAKRAITTLRTLYLFANNMELTERNPAKKVRVAPDKSREVFLTDAEVLVLRRVLQTMPQDAEHFFILAMTTGLRRSNVAGMRWEWVDLEGGVVTIPAEFSKNGEQIAIPLMAEAKQVLTARVGLSDKFVFPSAKAASGHLEECWYWLDEVRGKMTELGVTKQWTVHDLRRTLATRMTAAGAPLVVVAKMLSHSNINTTPIYARADLSTVRDWLGRSAESVQATPLPTI